MTEYKIRDLLKTIAEEQNIKSYDIELKSVSSGGANYSSTLHTARITSDRNVLHLFIKAAALGGSIRATVPFNVFELKKYVYTTLIQIFRGLEDQYKVPEEHRIQIPKYYGVSLNHMEELIVLEDLTARGFSSYDRLKSVDWKYAASAVQELAKYHALTVAFRLEHEEEYERFMAAFNHNWITQEMIQSVWYPGFESSLKVVREENKDRLKKYLDTFNLETVLRNYKPLKLKVLSHFDFRVSNMMHRVKEDGSVQVMPIDYQTIQQGRPTTDLIYFIFTGTDQQFRRQHLQQLVDHYYSQFSEALSRLGLDPRQVYSREDFHYEWKQTLPFGLAVAAFGLPIITVDSEEAPDISKGLNMESFTKTKTSALFPQRLNEVVDDYVHWNII